MSGRRRSAADLPRAPLELLHPMTVQGGAVVGAEIASEPTAPHTATLLRLYRALLAASAGAPDPAELDQGALRAMEADLLARMEEDPLAAPLAVLTAALLKEEDDRQRVTWACLCVSDWAIERGATSTAVSFAQLAALLWPQHARYAWTVGRLLFAQRRMSEAEPWYRRAHRVGVWTDDWLIQAKSLNSLGLACYERGKLSLAKRFYLRAIRVSRRHSVYEVEGMATHNLFVVHAQVGEVEAADRYAARAFELYGPQHPHLPEFVADIAFHWNAQGYYWRTLPIFKALLPHFHEPEARIRVKAALARAAGGMGDRDAFADAWEGVAELVPSCENGALAAAALYEAGMGAAHLCDRGLTLSILASAASLASRWNAPQVAMNAESALEKLQRDEHPEPARRRPPAPSRQQPADLLARELANSLGSELIAS